MANFLGRLRISATSIRRLDWRSGARWPESPGLLWPSFWHGGDMPRSKASTKDKLWFPLMMPSRWTWEIYAARKSVRCRFRSTRARSSIIALKYY